MQIFFSGKNNVLVQPKGYDSLFLGYLSLHQITIVGEDSSSLVLKWTPNQLMNGNTTEEKSASWQNAISIDLKTILFLHCHQVRAYICYVFCLKIVLTYCEKKMFSNCSCRFLNPNIFFQF